MNGLKKDRCKLVLEPPSHYIDLLQPTPFDASWKRLYGFEKNTPIEVNKLENGLRQAFFEWSRERTTNLNASFQPGEIVSFGSKKGVVISPSAYNRWKWSVVVLFENGELQVISCQRQNPQLQREKVPNKTPLELETMLNQHVFDFKPGFHFLSSCSNFVFFLIITYRSLGQIIKKFVKKITQNSLVRLHLIPLCNTQTHSQQSHFRNLSQ